MNEIQPVILSGGAGTRLWPASRAMYPKQLLPLVTDQTMLQQTASRLHGKKNLSPHAIVVCNQDHRFLVAEQLREIDVAARIILEPQGRNTAPAVALAAIAAIRESKGKSPILLVMPADHVINDVHAFSSAIDKGVQAAADGSLVLFGTTPTSAHTGYGYIEPESQSGGVLPIRRFIEKPDRETAQKMLDSGNHYWNAGIFLFRADRYLEELARYAPDMHDACQRSMDASAMDTDFIRPDAGLFAACPSDSIDYAIMEKSDRSAMVPLDAGWSDVGSWEELYKISAKDADGNVLYGDVITHECKNSYISASDRMVTAVGIENAVIVETKDSILVAARDSAQDIKALVDKLKDESRGEVNLHRQVFRPWGSYDSIDAANGFQVKRLIVNPGAILSLQKHAHRAEHWTVVRGKARITLNEDEFDLAPNESTYVPIGAVHRIANPYDEPVHIIEVQCGDYLGEDDIVRLEDNYGRQGTNT